MRTEIRFDDTDGMCQVITGPLRQTFLSSPRALGLALLSSAPLEDRTEGVEWHDHLATHGIAIGIHGHQVLTLKVLPVMPRTLRYGDMAYPITLPPLLIGSLITRGQFIRGVLFVIDPTRRASLSTIAPTPLLQPFPYGNIYETGRICWGEVRTDGIHTITDMETLFLASGFNTDLQRVTPEWRGGAVWAAPDTASGYRSSVPMAIQQLMRT